MIIPITQDEETTMPRKKVLTDFEKQVSELYYTPQEAQKVLGMTRDTFNNYVRRGTIKRYTILGSHGHFLKREIDALANKIEAALLAAETRTITFRRAQFSDLDAINHLAYYHFGDGALTPERKAARYRYLEANPDSTFCLFGEDALLASIDILPLKHEAVLEFREGKRGWQFPNEMIEQYEPGHPLELIIIDMMTTLNARPALRQVYALDLIRDVGQVFAEWGSKGVELVSIDACGGTELGRRILEDRFTYMGEKQPRRHMYYLDIASSDLLALKAYREAFAKWQADHKEEA